MATVFENCAIRTYELLAIEKLTDDPRSAWQMAAPAFTRSLHVQQKPCPIATFTGLWHAGLIKDSVPRPNYKMLRNAQYAAHGIDVLKRDPNLTKSQVWAQVPGTGGGSKAHDGQMDVLFALYQRGLIT